MADLTRPVQSVGIGQPESTKSNKSGTILGHAVNTSSVGGPYPVHKVQQVYDKAYTQPGIMGTHLDEEYSKVTKQTLLRFCEKTVNQRILDLGTGDGDLWQYASPSQEGHALDISYVGVSRAHQRFPSLHSVVGISENLPYPDRFFGAVVSADTMEHVFDINLSLREVRRVLVSGGIFALSIPTPDSLRRWALNRLWRQKPSAKLLIRLLYVVVRRTLVFGNAVFQPIDRDLTDVEWSLLLEENGFRVSYVEEWPKRPFEPIVYLIQASAV